MTEIPEVDLDSKQAPARIRSASEEIGFFYLRGHGVSDRVVECARAAARDFFALSLTEKSAVSVDDLHRGYLGFEQAHLSPEAETDVKESFVWGVDRSRDSLRPLVGPNQWPRGFPGLRAALEPYFHAVLESGTRLLVSFALALDLPEDYFVERYREPLARGSAIHYPPEPSGHSLGSSAHTDYGGLTLVAQDDVGGLQVETAAGRWTDVPPLPGHFVINIGDLMALWTDGRFRSTRHRVLSPTSRHRYTMATFFDPSYDTVIEAGGTTLICGDYVRGRFDDVFAYRHPRSTT